jgi:hypothetical protein
MVESLSSGRGLVDWERSETIVLSGSRPSSSSTVLAPRLSAARAGKADSLTFSLRDTEVGAIVLPVATKSPRLASGGEDGRGHAHLWHLRQGVAEGGIFFIPIRCNPLKSLDFEK